MQVHTSFVIAALAGVLLGCGGTAQVEAGPTSDIEELEGFSAKADGELRVAHLTLEAGEIKRYRIKAVGFVATIDQAGAEVPVQLSAKHYEYDIYGDVSTQPTVTAEADGTLRNWTLRVHNQGSETLIADVIVSPLPPETPEAPAALADSQELGIISDIDKTVLPKHTYGSDKPLPNAYPGVAVLYNILEHGGHGEGLAGDLSYVTARAEKNLEGIPEWMAANNLPEGPISSGVHGAPWLAQKEKVKDIEAILAVVPVDQPFVFFGDSSHRDPEVYREIRELHPERVLAVVIHKVNNVDPERVEGMHVITNYAQAAAFLYHDGILSEPSALNVIQAARAEGLELTDEDVAELLASE